MASSSRVRTGVNDLSTLVPAVAAQWHPTRNNDLLPTQVSRASNVKVWWLCDQGHEYEATVNNRTVNKVGCPYCSGKRVLAGFNDIATTHPDVAVQWHFTKNEGLLPTEVGKGSSKKAWWTCPQGHEYDASVSNRVNGAGCPFCSGKRVAPENALSCTHPDVAAQWHPTKNATLTPEKVTRASNKKVWWLCPECDGEWEAIIANRTLKDAGCPFCSGRTVEPGLNDLATSHPLLAAQWHPALNESLSPDRVRMGSPMNVWWICEQEHEWQSRINDRVLGDGCSRCYHEGLHTGCTPLRETHPALINEWDADANMPYTVDTISASSNHKVWWVCSDNPEHRWQALVSNRARNGSGCPLCWSARSTSQAENELYGVLTTLGMSVERQVRTMLGDRSELDLYIPERKFAVEFNGGYWHSEAAGKGKWYHNDKVSKCQDAGITLYQVWEDDWSTRPEIVIRGLAHRLGVTHLVSRILPDLPDFYTQTLGARKTRVVDIGFKQAEEFLNAHHIQGSATGTYYLGLVDAQDRLRAVLILARTSVQGELLISRYASAGVISGGFTKLLNHAQKTHAPKRWVTFADMAISDGGLYETTGFIVDKVLPPDYSYLVGKQRVHKFNYRIARFRTDNALLFEEGLTESELANLNGLVRVWDSGKIRYAR